MQERDSALIEFGAVPSHRIRRILGIDNIPAKRCLLIYVLV